MSVDAPRRSLSVLIALVGLCLPLLASTQPAPPPAGGGVNKQLSPDAVKALKQMQQAQSLQVAKKYPEAIAAYLEFERLSKTAKLPLAYTLSAYTSLAQCYQLVNDSAHYRSTLHAIIDLDPKNAKAMAQLAILEGTEHHFDQAADYADKTLALKPETGVAAAAHFVLGNVAVSHKDFAGAAREFGEAAHLMPKNAMAHYNYGLALAQEKKYAAAQKELETAIHLNPNNTSARFYLAEVQRQLNPKAPANSPYDVILTKDPHNAVALEGRALDLDRMGPLRTSDAIKAYQDAFVAVPNWFEGHYNVARLYASISNFPAAKQHFVKAHEIAVQQKNTLEDARTLSEFGYCEYLEGPTLLDVNQKVECYKSAETHLKQALAILPKEIDPKEAATLTPKEIESKNNVLKQQGMETKRRLAAVYENMGRFDEAVAVYRDILTQSPDDVTTYTHFANLYKKKGDVDDFVKTWKEYQARRPDDPTSYQEIGAIYRLTRNWDKAIAEWKLLLNANRQTNSTLSSTLVVIAQALVQLKTQAGYDEAEADYKRVLAMKPTILPNPAYQLAENEALKAEQYNALKGLADLASTENKTEEAIRWLSEVLKKDEERAKIAHMPMKGDAYHDIALLYERDKKLDLALDVYKKWSLAIPNDPIPFEERGRLMDVQGHVEESVAAYKAAALAVAHQNKTEAPADKTKDPVQDSLKAAEVYQRHKVFDKAIAELNALHKANPNNKEILSDLGLVYRETRQDLKSLETYDALLALDPSQRWVMDQKAIALMHLKRYDESKAIYVQEIDHNPTNRQTYADLALVYQEMGQRDAFLAWLKPRFEKTPANTTLMAVVYDEYVRLMHEAEGQQYILSVIDKVKPQRRAALEAYANQLQVHRHNPESLDVYRTIATENAKDLNAWMSLADQLDFNSKPEEADKIYLDQIARADLPAQERQALRQRLGMRYMHHGKLEEAQAIFEALHTQNPKDFNVAMTLGGVLIKRNRNDDAIAYYQKLLDIASYPLVVRVDIHLQIGALYEKENKKQEALNAYQEALKLDAKNAVAMDALKKLEGL